ncbi:uncharacterized protein C2orf74 homolog [Acomys russatus]|uniref:uncharacterized protein C2orf74 homolog n=1 Tax=Acomys russatus TaxID=60746 RepID=UPI0021E31D2B|nr:uncharacterized protein C2orf74 homolog [Acomys russatus]
MVARTPGLVPFPVMHDGWQGLVIYQERRDFGTTAAVIVTIAVAATAATAAAGIAISQNQKEQDSAFKLGWNRMFGQDEPETEEEAPKSSPLAFEITAITFFILLLVCFICILLLLAIFLYKCFKGKTDEEPVKAPCTDENEGEHCLAANAERDKPEDQDKVVLHFVNMDMPVRPGILVQRQSKEAVATHLEDNMEVEEDNRQTPDPARDATQEGERAENTSTRVHRTTSIVDVPKRPLKGVTFSKEVIVVDLGNEYPTARSYTRDHKERK